MLGGEEDHRGRRSKRDTRGLYLRCEKAHRNLGMSTSEHFSAGAGMHREERAGDPLQSSGEDRASGAGRGGGCGQGHQLRNGGSYGRAPGKAPATLTGPLG